MYSPFYTINDLVKLINMLDVKAHKYQNRRKTVVRFSFIMFWEMGFLFLLR